MSVKEGWVIHHDQATNPVYTNDFSHDRCVSFWKAVRDWHVYHNGWSDIAYSFGVCRHGTRFEGRGWSKLQFAGGADQIPDDLQYHDDYWYSCLFFIGDGEIPTPEMLSAFLALRLEGETRGQSGRRVIGHNTFRIKPCPGPFLTAWAATLDNTDPHQEPDMDARELARSIGATFDEADQTIKVPIEDGTPGVTNLVPLAAVIAYIHTELRRGRAGGWWPSPAVALDADVAKAVVAELARELED